MLQFSFEQGQDIPGNEKLKQRTPEEIAAVQERLRQELAFLLVPKKGESKEEFAKRTVEAARQSGLIRQ